MKSSIKNKWYNQDMFLFKLNQVEKYLRKKNYYKIGKNFNNCSVCREKAVGKGIFTINKVIWIDEMFHYIEKHNYKPVDEFIDFIFRFKIPNKKMSREVLKLKGERYIKNDLKYLKVDINQLLIIDALMKHGSYSKKYTDIKRSSMKYSEHAGLIDFNNTGLEKIIVSGNTNRVDKGDDSIFMPQNFAEAYDYEYIFHTHPATPKPGGRTEQGVLYEFPSISDMFHFLEHFNNGVTQGSLVMAPEGLYNIRKLQMNKKKIKINEDSFYNKIRREFWKVQEDAINFYNEFDTYKFYSEIAQDFTYIDRLNKVMNEFYMHIDYFPRKRDKSGKWIIDTVYLPVYVVEPDKLN